MIRKLIVTALLASSAPVSAQVVSALAQSSEKQISRTTYRDGIENGDIVVTGRSETQSVTKTDTPLIETPQAVSIVTRRQIEQFRPITVGEAFRYSAGIVPETFGVGSQYTDNYLRVRGFTPDVYLDGLRTVPFNSTDPYLLERAELLHGPASVLYGQSSPGGLVNLVSKRPLATAEGEIRALAGSFDRYGGMIDLTGPLDADGRFLYRLTGVGYTAHAAVDHTRQERIAVAPAFTWRPAADTSLTLLGNYTLDPALGPYAALPAVGTVLPNPNGHLRRSLFVGDPSFNHWRREQWTIGYLFEHRFTPGFSFRSNMRYGHTDTEERHVYGLSLAANGRTLSRYAYADDNDRSVFAIDNQLQGHVSTGPVSHTILAGLDFRRIRQAEVYGLNFGGVPPLDLFDPVYGVTFAAPTTAGRPLTVQHQTGVYGQDQMKLGDLSLVGSIRQDWAESRTTDRMARSIAQLHDSATTWRVGAVYDFHGIAPYASYSTSFQPQTGTDIAGHPFVPTRGRQYEAGIKYQPDWISGFFTLSAFDIRQTNVLTANPANPRFSIQTGAVRARGVELEAYVTVATDFNLSASYSYLDNKVVRSNTTNLDKLPPAIPRNTASAYLTYAPVEGIGGSLGIRYIGPTFGTPTNVWGIAGYATTPSRVPGFTLVDAALRYRFARHWEAAVNASNLFDKRFVASCLTATTCYFGESRTLLGSLAYRW